MTRRALPVIAPEDRDAARAARGMGAAGAVRTLWVWRSGNRKTGHTAATYRTQASCPITCPARTITAGEAAATGVPEADGYCYAESGFPAAFTHAARGEADGPGIPEDAAARLPHGYLVRFNVSGDYLAADGSPDAAYIAAADALAAARVPGCPGCEAAPDRPHLATIGYTHGWRTIPRGSFGTHAPRASCETADDIAAARAAGWATVITIPEDDPEGMIGRTVAGRTIAPCPAQLPAALTCDDCRACARPDGPTIAFRAHGSTRKRAARLAAGEDATA